MNWLADVAHSVDDMYAIHRDLLSSNREFQGKDAFKTIYVKKMEN